MTKSREDYIQPLPIKKDALYYVENIYYFLTEPNEYFILENGTIFIYPEENDDINNSEAFISTTGWFGFHCNKDGKTKKRKF